MKFSVTDQFLWDVYNFLEKAGSISRFIFKRRRTLYDVMPGPINPVIEKYRKIKNRKKFNRMVCYLKQNGFIKIKNLQGNNTIILTKKGLDGAFRASFKLGDGEKSKRKDGKWIMIIFDIPKNRRKTRDLLRSILENLGYKMFQYSVWITPYDVFEKTENILQFYRLDKYVKIFLIEELG